MEKTSLVVDSKMNALEGMMDQLPKQVWNTITEEELNGLAASSETAKMAIEAIKGFDAALSSKDTKKRGITIEMTESMILEDDHQGVNFTIVLVGQAWKFVGKISNLARGTSPQKDGTWITTENTFNSSSFSKELAKMTQSEQKDLEKQLKDAEKELAVPQKLVDKVKKELEKAKENADKLKEKLAKTPEKKQDGIKPKVDEAVGIQDRISAELKDAEQKAQVYKDKVAQIKEYLNALPK